MGIHHQMRVMVEVDREMIHHQVRLIVIVEVDKGTIHHQLSVDGGRQVGDPSVSESQGISVGDSSPGESDVEIGREMIRHLMRGMVKVGHEVIHHKVKAVIEVRKVVDASQGDRDGEGRDRWVS